MAGHGGGAWKVAYADFVTAMMAFFLVMWITAQSKPVKQAISQYFNDPWKTSPKPTGDAARGSALLPTTKPNAAPGPSLAPSRKPGSLGSERVRPGPRIHGRPAAPVENRADPADRSKPPANRSTLFAVHDGDEGCVGTLVLFDEGASELDEASKQRLKRLAPDIRGKPFKIEIRGHATQKSLSPGAAQDAWRLSYARCLATMSFLQQQGVAAERFRLSQGGPYEPYSIDQTPAKQAYNSRVEVYMLSRYAEELMGTPEECAARFTNQ